MGEGRTGTVFLAYHKELEEFRAIKRVSKALLDYEQFKKEALLLKELRHPGIPIVYDVEEDIDYSYLIEEYLEGESFESLIQNQGCLTGGRAVYYGIQICSLVQYLHSAKIEPILYLDLQPKNLLLCHETVKLIDFDHAAFEKDANLLKTRYGTRGFAAPEQYTGEPLDERTDIYAIGVIIYYLVTGTNLQESPDWSLFAGQKELEKIVRICLMPSKQDRYKSVQELREKLDCIKSQNVEWKQKNLPSLIIAFVGTAPNAGATHISRGLSVYLTQKNIPNLYEERNDSDYVRRLAERKNSRCDQAGIYKIDGCMLKPFYGSQVKPGNHQYPVVLRDFGDDIAAAQDSEPDIFVLISGHMWWEKEEAKAAGRRIRQKEWYLFHNLSNNAHSFWLKKRHREGRKEMSVPYFPDFCCLTKEAEKFFEKFAEEIGIDGRRRKCSGRKRKISGRKWI